MGIAEEVVVKLDDRVGEEKGCVTYKWLQKQLDVSAGDAQRLLQEYVDYRKDEVFSRCWVLQGKTEAGLLVIMVADDKADELRDRFTEEPRRALYSIQKTAPADARVLLATNPYYGKLDAASIAEERAAHQRASRITFTDFTVREAPVPAPAPVKRAASFSRPPAEPERNPQGEKKSKLGEGSKSQSFPQTKKPVARGKAGGALQSMWAKAGTARQKAAPESAPDKGRTATAVPHINDVAMETVSAASLDSEDTDDDEEQRDAAQMEPSPADIEADVTWSDEDEELSGGQAGSGRLRKVGERKVRRQNMTPPKRAAPAGETEASPPKKKARKTTKKEQADDGDAQPAKKPPAKKKRAKVAVARPASPPPPAAIPRPGVAAFFDAGLAGGPSGGDGGKGNAKEVTRTYVDDDGFEVTETVLVNEKGEEVDPTTGNAVAKPGAGEGGAAKGGKRTAASKARGKPAKAPKKATKPKPKPKKQADTKKSANIASFFKT